MAETETHESELPKYDGFMSQREAELRAGREKVLQNASASELAKKEADRLVREADERIKDDMLRRELILDTSVAMDKTEHDRAGAEIIDQAQTALEAIQHLADRQEPIIDMRRANRVERLEDETVDTTGAQELVTDFVTAQAVNQPTILAEQRGVETVGRPLNNTDGVFTDEELALAALPTPKDKHVPKTREQAESIASDKVPPVERMVKEAGIVSDYAPERNEAIDLVRAAPDEALSIDGAPETDVRSTTSENAFKKPSDVQEDALLERAGAKPRGRPAGSKNKQ